MKARKCQSSSSLTRFLLLLNAVLFLVIHHQQVHHFQVIIQRGTPSSTLGNGPSKSALEESLSSFHHGKQQRDSHATQQQTQQSRRPSRTLMGIFSSVSGSSASALMRSRHRTLIGLWNDTRLCSYTKITKDCQLVYAFIIGAGNASAPTQLVNDSWPLLVEKPIATESPDLNEDDTVLLNIRENMNEGKSESFFYFASTLMKQQTNAIDYAMKFDADASLLFHKFLHFAQMELPPAPYYRRILAGILRDKDSWKTPSDPAIYQQKEEYWIQEHDRVHVYLAGQCYLLSRDLVEWVVQEAPRSSGYREGLEDHDLSAMAFQSPQPLSLIIIQKKHRFWEHPVKGTPRWLGILKREKARMKGEIYKGKKLRVA